VGRLCISFPWNGGSIASLTWAVISGIVSCTGVESLVGRLWLRYGGADSDRQLWERKHCVWRSGGSRTCPYQRRIRSEHKVTRARLVSPGPARHNVCSQKSQSSYFGGMKLAEVESTTVTRTSRQ